MISERKLVASHSSFWRNLMPMGDAFVRGMNLKLQRTLVPRDLIFPGDRNALISELSSRVYALYLDKIPLDDASKQSPKIQELIDDVYRYIRRIEGSDTIPLMDSGEIDEAFIWAQRLGDCIRFTNPGAAIIPYPKFAGCGIIDDCEGDLLIGKTLYEIKNVERKFRSADIRQLLCYCALNFADQRKIIDAVGLVNARSGQTYKINLNDLTFTIAGMASNEFLGEIIRYITIDTPSR